MTTTSASKLLTKLNNSYREGLYTDVTFKVGTGDDIKEFKAYKLVLCLASPVFAAMFSEKWNPKSEIHLPDDDPHTFEHLLQFLHGSKLPDDVIDVMNLLPLVDKYDVEELISLCRVEIRNRARSDHETVLKAYMQAKALNFNDIAEELYTNNILHKSYFPSFTASPVFRNVDKELLLKILDEDKLRPKEEDIFSAIMKWLKHNAGSEFADSKRRPQIPLVQSLLKHIHFECIHPRFLKTEVKKMNVLSSKDLIQAFCVSAENVSGFSRKRDSPMPVLKRLQ